MAITDVRGTRWKINSVNCSAGYGFFSVNMNIYRGGNLVAGNGGSVLLYIGYALNDETMTIDILQANSVITYYDFWQIEPNDEIEFYDNPAVVGDFTNENLISWLEENATLVAPLKITKIIVDGVLYEV